MAFHHCFRIISTRSTLSYEEMLIWLFSNICLSIISLSIICLRIILTGSTLSWKEMLICLFINICIHIILMQSTLSCKDGLIWLFINICIHIILTQSTLSSKTLSFTLLCSCNGQTKSLSMCAPRKDNIEFHNTIQFWLSYLSFSHNPTNKQREKFRF